MPRPRSNHPCGTYLAYQAHIRRGEKPDDACTKANRDYNNERRLNPKPRRDNTFLVALEKAYEQLAEEYPERFREILVSILRGDKGSNGSGDQSVGGRSDVPQRGDAEGSERPGGAEGVHPQRDA